MLTKKDVLDFFLKFSNEKIEKAMNSHYTEQIIALLLSENFDLYDKKMQTKVIDIINYSKGKEQAKYAGLAAIDTDIIALTNLKDDKKENLVNITSLIKKISTAETPDKAMFGYYTIKNIDILISKYALQILDMVTCASNDRKALKIYNILKNTNILKGEYVEDILYWLNELPISKYVYLDYYSERPLKTILQYMDNETIKNYLSLIYFADLDSANDIYNSYERIIDEKLVIRKTKKL